MLNSSLMKNIFFEIKSNILSRRGGDIWLGNRKWKKEFRIVVDHKLSMNWDWDMAAKMANAILGCLKKNKGYQE